jgi:3-methyladenine DNA glycosylase AlkD
MDLDMILKELRQRANPVNVEGMARFGINPQGTLGISVVELRKLARKIGRDHNLALALWQTGIHEARLLAAFVDLPAQVTTEQMENWINDFDSWDICDQVCSGLFDRVPGAYERAIAWSQREAEFARRAGFVLMAALAVHDKKAGDEQFSPFFQAILTAATDDRNFVKKAVNWALRGIGKRNAALCQQAISCAEEILRRHPTSRAARWIARDALRELRGKQAISALPS